MAGDAAGGREGGSPRGRQSIAVIGSGVSGLSAAWLLSQAHDVTLYEAEERAGGHSHSVAVPGHDTRFVDTGFIVYNEVTYPNLTALFRHLGVATQDSDMSFAVSLDGGALEYAGTGLRGLLAQKRNLLRPRFWAMLRELLRFYREAPAGLADAERLTLGEWLDERGYGTALREDHLYPMAAAIWSAAPGEIADYPATAFIRFCHNHGLLKLRDRPRWRSVTGGSRRYVAALTAALGGGVRLGCPVIGLRRDSSGVLLEPAEGRPRRYDAVVVATHADQALRLLRDADPLEQGLLGAFRYSRNHAVLHRDPALMPRRRAAWSSWNYLGEAGETPCVTYWMNRLQDLPPDPSLFVTLNPLRPPAPDSVILSQVYEHPLFDRAALAAQASLWSLQGRRHTWFCGAYFGAGFHEDGLQAGLAVAEELGGVRRPWRVSGDSDRIVRHARTPEAVA